MRLIFTLWIAAFAVTEPALAGVEKMNEVAWWAAHGGTRGDGAFVCAMVSVTPANNDQKLIIEHLRGSQVVTLRLQKSTWAIPNGSTTAITIQFGYSKPFVLNAVGSSAELRADFSVTELDTFLNGLRNIGMTITFQGGNELPWSISGGGEGFIEQDFLRCLKMSAPAKRTAPTQPF